jgi:hypothetical protein
MTLLCFLQVSPLEATRFMPQRLQNQVFLVYDVRLTQTYNNAPWLASGLMKVLVLPPETCRATSRLEENKVGRPEIKGTRDTVSFPHLL